MKNEQRTSELHKLRTLHLFAGAGGGILADILLGHHPVCAVEIEPYCQQVLSARQKDGHLPWFPIFDDVQTFDGKPWHGLVDIVAGGFPCQDISAAGKGAGLSGERSGLWGEMRRIIGEIRPGYAFVENSPMLTVRGLDRVLGDFAEMGYDVEWGVVSAADCGALHERERIWIMAYSPTSRLQGDKHELKFSTKKNTISDLGAINNDWDDIPQPYGLRSLNGIPNGVDKLKCLGNAQVPIVAATAWQVLTNRLH
jgi:DNA (cytosine-5)-methyltransferase 1